MQPEGSQRQLAWATPLPALIAVAVGGVILAVGAVATGEAAGKLLLGMAALALLAMAALGLRQRPRLAVIPGDQPRLVVRGLSGPVEYTREQIQRARVVGYRRLGRKSPMLELDVDHAGTERLLIFGRWDLGVGPEDVYEILRTELRLRGETTR